MTTVIESDTRDIDFGKTTSRSLRLLARLPCGRWAKYVTIVLWIILAGISGMISMKLSEVQDNDQLGGPPATAESGRAQELINREFTKSNALIAVVVYTRDNGLTPADHAKVAVDREIFTQYAESGLVKQPVASKDGAALLVRFPLAGSDEQQSKATNAIREQLAVNTPAGLRASVTGSAGARDDTFDAMEEMDITLLLATALTVTLLLIIIYRSPVLWLVPLVVVAVASQAANAVVYLLAKFGNLTIDFQGNSILTVLVFGVGVDYALLIISRYREELRLTEDPHIAMATALRRAFPAIIASAGTVAIGMLCLLAADLPSTKNLGPVGAIGIICALLAMMTLLPAILLLCGRWLFWPFLPRVGTGVEQHRIWRGIASMVESRPRAIWIASAVALGVLVIGIGPLSIGIPNDGVFKTEVGSITGQHLIERHFPAGVTSPAEIIAVAASGERVVDAVRGVSGVAAVEPPQRSVDGRWVLIRAVLAEESGAEALATARRVRTAAHAVGGSKALVTGEAAIELDTQQITYRDNWVVMPMILGVVVIILVLLLRAIVAPILLIVSVVLSYAGALGAGGLILHAMGYPQLWEGIPLQTFLFLVALGVDYTIFLMARARQETATHGHHAGILRALTVTGGVITSAGVVLAATFFALNVLPMVPSTQMGVIVACGILLDTLVVRTLLVPALTLDIGPVTWWPGQYPGISKGKL